MKMESWLDEYVHIRTWNVVKGQKARRQPKDEFGCKYLFIYT